MIGHPASEGGVGLGKTMKEDLLHDPVFGMAADQFDRVADFLGLEQKVRERCKWPKTTDHGESSGDDG